MCKVDHLLPSIPRTLLVLGEGNITSTCAKEGAWSQARIPEHLVSVRLFVACQETVGGVCPLHHVVLNSGRGVAVAVGLRTAISGVP